MNKTLNYEWVCHACAHANKAGQPHCSECGCSASAGIEEIESHRSGERTSEIEQEQIELSRILLGVCGAILGLLFKFFLWS